MTRSIVSLLPAATEIVAALGAAHALVGVTHECDYPPEASRLPRVTASAVDAADAAGDVDRQVRERSSAGAALFVLRGEALAALRPEVVLTQALCEVCAVSEDDVRALAARLDPAPRVVTLSATTLDGVLADIERVGRALGRDETAAAVVEALRARMRAVHERLKSARAPRRRVAVIEWTDPVFAAGHWVPEMVHRAGGIDVLAAPGEHSTVRRPDAVRAADPEVVLVAPCGYGASRAACEAERLLERPEWAWARERDVWALDANGLVSRPGPRLVRGLEVMAAIFSPRLFDAPAPVEAVPVRQPNAAPVRISRQ
jgi:iron complex transport system substrate-binding protein